MCYDFKDKKKKERKKKNSESVQQISLISNQIRKQRKVLHTHTHTHARTRTHTHTRAPTHTHTHSHTHSQGCMRMAPSSLMTSPLIIGFSASDVTRWANSAGSPRREGKGTWRARNERTFSGRPARRGVENRPAGREEGHEGRAPTDQLNVN